MPQYNPTTKCVSMYLCIHIRVYLYLHGLEEEYDDSGAQRYKGLPMSGKSKRKHPAEESDLTTERTTEMDLTTKRTTMTQPGWNVPPTEPREHSTQVDDGDQSS